MITMSPKEVKDAVIKDLKQRHLTQQTVATMMGMTRQTIATILSSDEEFFSERHANLFSSVLGYNKEFLSKGSGPFLREDSPQLLEQRLENLDRMMTLYMKATAIAELITSYLCSHPDNSEKNRKLLYVLNRLVSFSSSIRDTTASSSQSDRMDALELLFEDRFSFACSVIEQECGIKIHYLGLLDTTNQTH